MIEMKYLNLVKAIVEEGSLSKATKKLYLTQSALSHQLKDLEKQLNFKVFNKVKNNWTLTQKGSEIYQLSIDVNHAIDKRFLNINRIGKGVSGTVRIGTECYSFYKGFANFLQEMNDAYPNINIVTKLEATHKPLSQLLNYKIDIAIVTEEPSAEELLSTASHSDEIYAIMNKNNHLSDKEYVDTIHFNDVNLIIHSYPLETVSIYKLLLQPHNIIPKNITAIPMTEVALEMVESNLGIICLPKWTLDNFIISKNIHFKKITMLGLYRTHYIVIRKEDRNNEYINAFINNFKHKPL